MKVDDKFPERYAERAKLAHAELKNAGLTHTADFVASQTVATGALFEGLTRSFFRGRGRGKGKVH